VFFYLSKACAPLAAYAGPCDSDTVDLAQVRKHALSLLHQRNAVCGDLDVLQHNLDMLMQWAFELVILSRCSLLCFAISFM